MGPCFSTASAPELAEPMLSAETKIGPGTKLSDEYKVLGGILGYGRLATVREGVDKKTGQLVAIKSCSKKLLSARPARISRTSEIEAMIKVWEGLPPSPHLVALLATFEDRHSLYLVQECVQGGDLFHHLASRDVFTEGDALSIVRQILSVIKHCHDRNVVHRDLKPENILLSSSNDSKDNSTTGNSHAASLPPSSTIKLVDFGSAAIMSSPNSILADFMATPFYAAPEVWEHRYSKPADVWSVGAILYVLLTGLPPVLNTKSVHEDATWQQLQKGVAPSLPASSSASVRDLLSSLLHPDPSLRITAAAALSHPCLTGAAPVSTANLEGSIRNIRAYTAVAKFQKVAVALLSVSSTEPELKLLGRRLKDFGNPSTGANSNGSSSTLNSMPSSNATNSGAKLEPSSDHTRRVSSGRGCVMRQAQLEAVLEEEGMVSQVEQLRLLRKNMLGPGPEGEGALFAVDDFLDLLQCRQLASREHAQVGKRRGGRTQLTGTNSMKPLQQQGQQRWSSRGFGSPSLGGRASTGGTVAGGYQAGQMSMGGRFSPSFSPVPDAQEDRGSLSSRRFAPESALLQELEDVWRSQSTTDYRGSEKAGKLVSRLGGSKRVQSMQDLSALDELGYGDGMVGATPSPVWEDEGVGRVNGMGRLSGLSSGSREAEGKGGDMAVDTTSGILGDSGRKNGLLSSILHGSRKGDSSRRRPTSVHGGSLYSDLMGPSGLGEPENELN